MPPCKNDNSRNYSGTEPSPKGLGYCAHAEKINTIKEGLDNNYWYVSPVGDSKKWKLLRLPSKWFNNFKKINKIVNLDTTNFWLKKYDKELKNTIITKIKKGKNYNDIIVYHTSSKYIDTNKKFVEMVKSITKQKFVFSEQGLQDNKKAHMELDNNSILQIIKLL